MNRTTTAKTKKPPAAASRSRAEQPPARTYLSRAVQKALQALDCIRESPEPMSLQDVAAAIHLSKASAFRLLHTLEALHYLSKAPSGLYSRPGHGPQQIASRFIHQMLSFGEEPLNRLAQGFRETASMAALFDNHIEVLLVAESPQLIRMGNTPGRILPPNASSLGKAITAFQPAEVAEKLVRSYGMHSYTANTITDERALQEEFARIRKNRFAEDLEESVAGGRCFARPILRPDGTAIGAISLSMPLMRFQGDNQRKTILAAVGKAADEVQQRITAF